jgi:peptidyl-prolyl cis-trans isomerase D
MFDFVRKHTKILMGFMFLLIIPSFVLFGLEGYSRNDGGVAVARVDGRDIKQTEWDNAHKNEVDRLRTQMPTLDIKLLDTPQARYATLERLVRDRVLAAAANKSNLITSDQRLARELQTDPTIASLRGPDGRLDMERYKQMLGSQGQSPAMFEAQVRADLSTRQLLDGIRSSGFAPTAVVGNALNAFYEKREVQVAQFPAAEFAAKLKLEDAQLEVFYRDNPVLFQAQEQANIEYLVFDIEAIKKSIKVSEEELKTYYTQNSERLAAKEERRASHILISSPKSASAADRNKARAQAEALQVQAVKTPDSFADLARKNSQDTGSAPSGGDLDFFAKGAMVKPFEDAAFAMKKGDISAVVESDFGFHIIRLTDIKSAKQRTFEEMRADMELDVQKQLAQKQFAEQAEAFTNSVYEQPDLKGVAERFKLQLRIANNITRQPATGATGALANPKFLTAVFAPDSVEKKTNTPAVEMGANQLAAARIVQYTPARTQAFADVKEQVRLKASAQRGMQDAKEKGLAQLAAWKAQPASANLAAAVMVSRLEGQLPAPVVDAAMRADSATLPAWIGVDLGTQGYAVVRVNRVAPRDPPVAEAAKQEQAQYSQLWSSAEGLAYYNLLKERVKAQIKVPKPSKTLDEVAAVGGER